MTTTNNKPCAYDSCDQPGYCDGRHCASAGGAIRLDPGERKCLVCSKPFTIDPLVAPHKRFCSKECRTKFHTEERREAIAALRKK